MARKGPHMKHVTKGMTRRSGHGTKSKIGRTGHPKRLVTRGGRG